jgi:hypothetical protein
MYIGECSASHTCYHALPHCVSMVLSAAWPEHNTRADHSQLPLDNWPDYHLREERLSNKTIKVMNHGTYMFPYFCQSTCRCFQDKLPPRESFPAMWTKTRSLSGGAVYSPESLCGCFGRILLELTVMKGRNFLDKYMVQQCPGSNRSRTALRSEEFYLFTRQTLPSHPCQTPQTNCHDAKSQLAPELRVLL